MTEKIILFLMKMKSTKFSFKRLKKLSNNKHNKRENEFIIEGVKETSMAIKSNLVKDIFEKKFLWIRFFY